MQKGRILAVFQQSDDNRNVRSEKKELVGFLMDIFGKPNLDNIFSDVLLQKLKNLFLLRVGVRNLHHIASVKSLQTKIQGQPDQRI